MPYVRSCKHIRIHATMLEHSVLQQRRCLVGFLSKTCLKSHHPTCDCQANLSQRSRSRSNPTPKKLSSKHATTIYPHTDARTHAHTDAQKKLVRIVHHEGRLAHTNCLFKQMHSLKFHDFVKYRTAIVMFKLYYIYLKAMCRPLYQFGA